MNWLENINWRYLEVSCTGFKSDLECDESDDHKKMTESDKDTYSDKSDEDGDTEESESPDTEKIYLDLDVIVGFCFLSYQNGP